ncbi:hypothetical protein PAPYR_2397 [Paratrimastix pyriformis]|uniref:Damage-control phosphatase ARMT1-like metal-binding domain-containing protein n=1 Tax=Paratrimastix pyriformis TaxID=342808 RepID=A0ABQ8UVF0_9EUKA|nr:hypothetical protein PAPYR_2397 [Paratrimastix pyriformis]
MKLHTECVPCFFRALQVICARLKVPRATTEQIMRDVMQFISTASWDRSPIALAHHMHRILRDHLGYDPYLAAKEQSNQVMMSHLVQLQKLVRSQTDPLESAMRLAAAANAIDFGLVEHLPDPNTIIREGLTNEISINHIDQFKKDLTKARRLLWFCDNAGEIVFDRVALELIGELYPGLETIEICLKGGPIINDAQLADAEACGLDRVPRARLVTIGNGTPGTGPDRDSDEVAQWVGRPDQVVVSKGQANFEGLSEYTGIYYCLKLKCPPVAAAANGPLNGLVLLYR